MKRLLGWAFLFKITHSLHPTKIWRCLHLPFQEMLFVWERFYLHWNWHFLGTWNLAALQKQFAELRCFYNAWFQGRMMIFVPLKREEALNIMIVIKWGEMGPLINIRFPGFFFILISGVVSPYFSSSPPPPLRRLPVQSAIQRELATPEDKMYLAMGLATLNDHFFCLGIENFWKKKQPKFEKRAKKTWHDLNHWILIG